jgi:hypothetical protein
VNRAVTQTRTTGVVAALLVTEAVLRTALHAVEWYDAVLWHRYLTGQPVSFDEIDTADGIGALVLFLHLPTMVAACVAVAVWHGRRRRGTRAALWFGTVAWSAAWALSVYTWLLHHSGHDVDSPTPTTLTSAGVVLLCWGTTIPLVLACLRRDRPPGDHEKARHDPLSHERGRVGM